MNTHFKDKNSKLFETIINQDIHGIAKKLTQFYQIIDFYKQEIDCDYFYIAGGCLRDIHSGILDNIEYDIDIFFSSEKDSESFLKWHDKNYELVSESNYSKKFINQDNIEIDVTKFTRKPHFYLNDTDFINSAIILDSNYDLFYHQEFPKINENQLLKINPSISSQNSIEMLSFRFGKFIERGYKYCKEPWYSFFNNMHEILITNSDTYIFKLKESNKFLE